MYLDDINGGGDAMRERSADAAGDVVLPGSGARNLGNSGEGGHYSGEGRPKDRPVSGSDLILSVLNLVTFAGFLLLVFRCSTATTIDLHTFACGGCRRYVLCLVLLLMRDIATSSITGNVCFATANATRRRRTNVQGRYRRRRQRRMLGMTCILPSTMLLTNITLRHALS